MFQSPSNHQMMNINSLITASDAIDDGLVGVDINEWYESILLEIENDDNKLKQQPDLNILLREVRTLILKLHARRHQNFRAVIEGLQAGDYDDDEEITDQYNNKQLNLMKKITHRISYKQFACIDCLLKHIKSKPRRKLSQAPDPLSPMSEGHIDVLIFPKGYADMGYGYLYICDDTTYGIMDWRKRHNMETFISVAQMWRFYANDLGWSMRRMHFDADPVLIAQKVKDALADISIGARYSPPGEHWRNGLVERWIETFDNNGLTMLLASELPSHLYIFAIKYALFLHNVEWQTRRRRRLGQSARFQPWNEVHGTPYVGKKPVFGQLVVAGHIDPTKLLKMEDKGRYCAFLGFENDLQYTLFHLPTKRVITSKTVLLVKNTYAWSRKPIVSENLNAFGANREDKAPSSVPLSTGLEGLNRSPKGPTSAPTLSENPAEIGKKKRVRQETVANTPTIPGPEEFRPDLEGLRRRSRRIQHLAPEQVLANCISVINNYYDEFESYLTDVSHYVGTPKYQKNGVEVLNTHVMSRYRIGEYYERGLRADEINGIIADTRRSMHHPLECEAYAVKVKGKHRSKLVDFMDGKGSIMFKIPYTVEQAMSIDTIHIYQPAIKLENQSFIDKGCLGPAQLFADLPAGTTVIKVKYHFDVKVNEKNEYKKGKARLVSKGYMLRYMVHYRETYSPTANIESVRYVVYLVVVCDFHSFTMDVTVAFISSPRNTKVNNKKVYVILVPGMDDYDREIKKVKESLTNLYGNPDAGRVFYEDFMPKLLLCGYVQIVSDPCVLWYRSPAGLLTIMALHVDNITAATQDPLERVRLHNALLQFYQVTSENGIDEILGMTLHRNPNSDGIMLAIGYFTEVAKALGLNNLKSSRTMGDPKQRFIPNLVGKASKEMIAFYRTLLGCMLYPSRMFRLDSANRVRELSAFAANPSFEHIDALIVVLRRCLTTETWGLLFRKPPMPIPRPLKFCIIMWTDADWNKEWGNKSVSGTILQLAFPEQVAHGKRTGMFGNFNVLSYRSKKQAELVADSTLASETAAGCVGVKDGMYFKNFLTELGMLFTNKNLLLSDNKAFVLNVNNYKIPPSMRHYGLKIAFIFHEVEGNDLEVWWTTGASMMANQLTKQLPPGEALVEALRVMGFMQ